MSYNVSMTKDFYGDVHLHFSVPEVREYPASELVEIICTPHAIHVGNPFFEDYDNASLAAIYINDSLGSIADIQQPDLHDYLYRIFSTLMGEGIWADKVDDVRKYIDVMGYNLDVDDFIDADVPPAPQIVTANHYLLHDVTFAQMLEICAKLERDDEMYNYGKPTVRVHHIIDGHTGEILASSDANGLWDIKR